MEYNSARELEVVLRLAEKSGAHVVAFQAERDARVPTIVRPSTSFDDVGVAALSRHLRLFVGTPKNSVQPWFPLSLPPGDLRSGAVRCNLHVLILKNCGSKGGRNIA